MQNAGENFEEPILPRLSFPLAWPSSILWFYYQMTG